MTSLNNFCHNYHVPPSSNKHRTLSTTVRTVFIGIVTFLTLKIIIVVIIH